MSFPCKILKRKEKTMSELTTIRVMTFNLRVASNTGDGINRFANRAPRIEELLRAETPDLIGFQEATDLSRAFLEDRLSSDYLFLGCGRDSDCRKESCTVAIRRKKFALISFETIWLSETPEVPGSRLTDCDQSVCPRLAHILRLHPYGHSGMFRFVNTHLDHVGETTRKLELKMLTALLRIDKLPGVLTGDFNATPESKAIRAFSEELSPLGWRDATEGTGETFHGFGQCTPPLKIDYIYTNCRTQNSRVLARQPIGGVYDSDHYAVVTDLIL